MRGKYLVRDISGYLYLSALDAALSLLPRGTRAPNPPARIVIGIGGHLGDALLASGTVAAVREAFPHAEIGVAGSQFARPVFISHPAVQHFHQLDHWQFKRANGKRAGIGRLRDSYRQA
jgi:hypothetical protein